MSGAVAQTKVGRARHSVRAAVCNRFSERRARSDAPYLSKGVQAVSHGVSRGEKFVVAKSPREGRQNSDPREFSFAADAAPISNTETETHG